MVNDRGMVECADSDKVDDDGGSGGGSTLASSGSEDDDGGSGLALASSTSNTIEATGNADEFSASDMSDGEISGGEISAAAATALSSESVRPPREARARSGGRSARLTSLPITLINFEYLRNSKQKYNNQKTI